MKMAAITFQHHRAKIGRKLGDNAFPPLGENCIRNTPHAGGLFRIGMQFSALWRHPQLPPCGFRPIKPPFMLATPTTPTKRHVWRHDFGHGLRCTATLSPSESQISCEWSRQPPVHNRGHMKAYIRWMRHVQQQAAEITGQRILQLVQVGPDEWVSIVAGPKNDATA